MLRRVTRHFAFPLGVMIALMAATLLPLCGAIFGCGCDMVHGAGRCNIHNASGPHCPWCSGGGVIFGIDFVIILGAVTGSMALVRRRWGRGIGLALTMGCFTYLATAGVVGWATARVVGYPLRWGF
jgi:hypothetical protein